jgi:hypothetical protein
MSPKSVDEVDGNANGLQIFPHLRQRDARRPEYRPLAPALALHRARPQDGWQPVRTCAVCGQHIDKTATWPRHMKRLHPYAPRSANHGVSRPFLVDPTNDLRGQGPQREAYMSTAAFLRGLVVWIASNNGQDPPLSPPLPAQFQDLVGLARRLLGYARRKTKVDKHLQAIQLLEDIINEQTSAAQPSLTALITALRNIYDQLAPLLSLKASNEKYIMIEDIVNVLVVFFVGEEADGDYDQNSPPLPMPPPSARKPGSRPQASQKITAARSARGTPNFRIARLIRNFDKVGIERDPEIDPQDPEFTVNFGDYLLHLGHDPAAWISSFRNMAGQEGLVPVRMIQEIHLPWGLPENIQITDDGVGIPIEFATDDLRNAAPMDHGGILQNKALLVSDGDANVAVNPLVLDLQAELIASGDIDANESFRNVLNVERSFRTIHETYLDKRYDYPWNLRISADWLAQRLQIIRGEEAEPEEAQADDAAIVDEDPIINDSQDDSGLPDGSDGQADQDSSPGAEPAPGSLQAIFDADAATLNDLLARPTVKAHRRYQRAIRLLQTRRDGITGNLGREIDELIDRDRMRAAYRGLHDQIGGFLVLTFKEDDCHEIISIIIDVLRRFEPEDSPLEASDPDSPFSPIFPGSQNANIRGNNNTTVLFRGGRTEPMKVYQKGPRTGKRSRKDSAVNDNNEDEDDDGGPHRKKLPT